MSLEVDPMSREEFQRIRNIKIKNPDMPIYSVAKQVERTVYLCNLILSKPYRTYENVCRIAKLPVPPQTIAEQLRSYVEHTVWGV
jgi:hypothetical protein